MPDEPDNAELAPEPGGADDPDRPSEDGDEGDRPTLSPPFDPVAFARDLLKTPVPSARVTAPPASRATPPVGMEQSTFRPAAPATPPPEATPTGLPPVELSARFPESVGRLGVAVDREWAALELATRPPPAGAPVDMDVDLGAAPAPKLPDLDLGALDAPIESGAETVRRPQTAAADATSSAATKPPKPRSTEMNDLVELGDYSGALEIAEEILRSKPDDLGARTVAETCRTVLRQMYATRIGPLDRVPVVMVPRDQLRWLSIDHKAGFVLSLVDGVSSLEMIIDVSGMPELDTLRILSELAQQRIISLR